MDTDVKLDKQISPTEALIKNLVYYFLKRLHMILSRPDWTPVTMFMLVLATPHKRLFFLNKHEHN